MADKPAAKSSLGNQELDKAEKQFEAFDSNVKQMTMDRMNQAPIREVETPNIAQQDIAKAKDIYLKPFRTIGSREKFNEDYRKDYEFSTEYVHFTAHNHEIIGEDLQFWTKPYAGMPVQEWKVPTNKPVWAPRHVAERIKGCSYHTLTMDQTRNIGTDGSGQFFGAMAVDKTVQRLDALPVSSRRSVFMGAANF